MISTVYIKPMAATIRFKKLNNLTPQELYYIAVLGANELYTSSFVSGILSIND